MRSIFILIVAFTLTLFIFACSGETDNPNVTNEVQKDSIVKSPPTSTPTPVLTRLLPLTGLENELA